MINIAIQIVNYNTKAYLEACLVDLLKDLKSCNLSYGVLVLDNNSSDDLSDLKRVYGDNKLVSFYSSDKNLGFGVGHNLLASKVGSQYLLILNPDIRFVQPKTVERLLGRLISERASVVGPKLVTPQGKAQRWDHGELSGWRAWIALNSGGSWWKDRLGVVKTAWVSGAFFLVEREIFNGVGGFDDRFFLYKEEEDLCLRIRKMGGKIIYDPTVEVLHYGSVVAGKEKYMEAAKDYFLGKHFKHRITYKLLKFLNRFGL